MARVGRRALGVVTVALLAGCGSDGAGVGGAEPVTSVLPATTMAPLPPGPPTTTAASPAHVATTAVTPAVGEPATTAAPSATMAAPTTAASGQPRPSDAGVSLPPPAPLSEADAAEVPCRDVRSFRAAGGPSLAEAGRLEPMLGVVLAYGQQHADVWGGYAMTWHSADDASALIGITRDVAEHREALEDMVEFPDELIVCRSPLTVDQRPALMAELEPELRDRAQSWSPGSTAGVEVMLRDDQETYAAEVAARYGERVDLSVGNFPYPMPDPLPRATCERLPEARTVDGLEVIAEPPPGPLQPAANAEPALAVRFRNTGSTDVSVSFGAPQAVLLEPGSDRIVGGYAGAVADVLDIVRLAPGEEATRRALVGATTCDPAMGYRLPAGTYDLVIVLQGTVQDGPPVLTPRVGVDLAAP